MGCVYFIGTDDGHVKIGMSKGDNPASRLKGIQTGNHRPLKILFYIKTDTDDHANWLESCFHRFYSDLKTSGEWFVFDNRIETFLNDCMRSNNRNTADLRIGYDGISIGRIFISYHLGSMFFGHNRPPFKTNCEEWYDYQRKRIFNELEDDLDELGLPCINQSPLSETPEATAA